MIDRICHRYGLAPHDVLALDPMSLTLDFLVWKYAEEDRRDYIRHAVQRLNDRRRGAPAGSFPDPSDVLVDILSRLI